MVKVAIVGATGVVGTKMIEMFEQYGIEADEITLLSSARSAGKKLQVMDEELTVQELTDETPTQGFDYVVMSAGGATSRQFALCLKRMVQL